MASQAPSTPALLTPEKRTQLSKDSSIHHRQRAKRLQPTIPVQLGAICLTSLIIGLNDITTFAIPETAASPDSVSQLLRITYTALPVLLGSILAAAFLDPVARALPSNPFSLLAHTNLLTCSAHATMLMLLRISCDGTVPPVVLAMSHLLTGIGNTTSLVVVILWCSLPTRGALLGVIHGVVALGMVLGAVMAGVDAVGGDGGGTAGWRRGYYHLIVSALALLNTALLHTASQSNDVQKLAGTPSPSSSPPSSHDDTEAQPSNITPPTPKNPLPIPKTPSDKTDNFPPPPPSPPSTRTLLTALLALSHLATMAALPSWLVSALPTTTPSQSSLTYTTAALWTGVTCGRFTAAAVTLSSRRLERFISPTLIATSGLLGLFWFAPGNIGGNGNAAIAAGALAGFALGAVYPSAVGMLVRGMDEGERLGGVGIVVAFGYAGAVGGLVIVRVAACLGGTVVLHLVVAGGFAGMVLCWKGLVDDKGGVEGGSACGVEV